MNFKDFARVGLSAEKKQLIRYKQAIKSLPQGSLTCKKNKRGRKQYYITVPNSHKNKYANKKMLMLVYRLKQRKKAEIKASLLENNIAVREYVLENYVDCSDDAVEEMLPKAYRRDDELNAKVNVHKGRGRQIPQSENPYRREELKHITSFNLRVRSKGELIMAEELYAAGLEFYYEKRLELYDEDGNIKVVYPDFTIVFPGGFIVYWEHKGMLDDKNYMLHDIEKTQLYYRNGIFEPHNLIVTTDGPDNMTDMEAVHRIISGMLLPLMGI